MDVLPDWPSDLPETRVEDLYSGHVVLDICLCVNRLNELGDG